MQQPETNNEYVECMVSDTDLLLPTLVQTELLEGQYEEIYPVTYLNDGGPVEIILETNIDNSWI